MFNKTHREEQFQEVNKYLMELRKHFELFLEMSKKPIPDTPSPFNATEENIRQSLLDQRAYYMNMKIPFELIDSTLEQLNSVWNDGKEPIKILKEWSKNFQKIFDNNIEENKLWEGSDPMGSKVNIRRQQLFAENRILGQKTNELLRKSAEQIYNLLGINIIEWMS